VGYDQGKGEKGKGITMKAENLKGAPRRKPENSLYVWELPDKEVEPATIGKSFSQRREATRMHDEYDDPTTRGRILKTGSSSPGSGGKTARVRRWKRRKGRY